MNTAASQRSTTAEAFFEAKYRASEDPWDFARNSYETQRYEAILHALQGRRFQFSVEPGCSVGVLTERLAAQCDRVDAFDISATASARAASRCSGLPWVNVTQNTMANYAPHGADLLMLCEVGYYFSAAELATLLARYIADLSGSATVLGCHWLGHSPDHVLHGDEVHAILHRTPGLIHEYAARHEHFRLDLWRKRA